jgi:hypothetical protein
MVGDVQAVLIAADWRVGSKLTVQPGDRVEWAMIPRPAGAAVTLRILTGVDPAQLEIRYFTGLTASGVPTDNGTLVECKPSAGTACKYAPSAARSSP